MKILWALDPFEENKKLQLFGRDILKAFFDKKDSVDVLYVASNSEAKLATAYNVPLKNRYSAYPKKLIREAIKKMELRKIGIEVLFEESLSLTSVVKNVTSYCRKKSIDLVLIATNSKKFLPRLIFGSFAETIVHLSPCDLLIYHQETKFNQKTPKNILYAYDFSSKGLMGLKRLILYANKWHSNITIVHLALPEGGMTNTELRKMTEKRIQKLREYLESQKIKFEVSIHYEIKPISEAILQDAVKFKADVIAVAAKAKRLEALLGGSITRQVLRESSNLVLVLKV